MSKKSASSSSSKVVRCAIYTRKSTEEGLEQDFNSLHAQREASEAYIHSQKHEGWEIIPTHYDDGGYSGGTMERPALRQLLEDIEAGKVDIVVVYKVDRLSRALSDFAKMIDLFDQHHVSFVSVTQSFNTTSSMGRLTLNVLLSFAQFEREVTGERIRDKIAASKKKGMWMGGPQPLGYDIKNRKLVINPKEATIIRTIYEGYLNKPTDEPLHLLLEKLKAKGYRNKSYISQRGNQITGKEFTLPQLYLLLNNPIYQGKISHKGTLYEGEHEAVISEEMWQAVQQKIDRKQFTRRPNRKDGQPKLIGKLRDYHGIRFMPTYSYKYSAAGRYKMRYYLNQQLSKTGKTASEFRRIRAEMIDEVLYAEVRALFERWLKRVEQHNNHNLVTSLLPSFSRCLAKPYDAIESVTLYPNHMEVRLVIKTSNYEITIEELANAIGIDKQSLSLSPSGDILITLHIPACYKRRSNQLHIITERGDLEEADIDAQDRYANDKTTAFLAASFYWNKQIDQGIHHGPKDIAESYTQNREYIKKAINQRFLSPKIVEHILSPDTVYQIPIDNLSHCRHWCWEKQEAELLTQYPSA